MTQHHQAAQQSEFAFIESHPDVYGDVRGFHRKFVPFVPPARPTFIPEVVEFRMRFLDEEFNHELKEAIEKQNLPEIADSIADIIYVAIGFAIELGIPFQAVWAEVQRSNMEKVKPDLSHPQAWKYCVKPPNWLGPRVERILLEHGYVEGEVGKLQPVK